MKKLVLSLTLLAAVTGLAASLVSAAAAPKAEKGVIIGRVVDVATYAMKGSAGEEHSDAFLHRAELGFPVAIVEEESGEVYIAVFRTPAPASALETANNILAPLMGKKVAAQGLIYRAQGVNLIRLSVVSEY